MFVLYTTATALILFLLFYFFYLRRLRRYSNSVKFFHIALKSENDCNFELAISQYHTALAEIKRTGNNFRLKTKILEKIKLLKIVLQYQKG
ncbi:hypothetical protein LZZ85_12355 [Terrimonas sp. NA20]|uniref:Tetratricopeptide repeat protein n=1 Tax=Terrimonas ginsenosidimutans TaxID=2908004 RepID=A0ABS9KRX6_9BACT|nr:hypothetical protein [Terrimonas ginsenosidimutans]MCG2615082.1 hypothetical protein [Terrimonas ginsenosidimutans]